MSSPRFLNDEDGTQYSPVADAADPLTPMSSPTEEPFTCLSLLETENPLKPSRTS